MRNVEWSPLMDPSQAHQPQPLNQAGKDCSHFWHKWEAVRVQCRGGFLLTGVPSVFADCSSAPAKSELCINTLDVLAEKVTLLQSPWACCLTCWLLSQIPEGVYCSRRKKYRAPDSRWSWKPAPAGAVSAVVLCELKDHAGVTLTTAATRSLGSGNLHKLLEISSASSCQPDNSIFSGWRLTRRWICRKGCGSPGGQQVKREPTLCPCSKENKWHPGLD